MTEALGQFDALFEGDAFNGDERDHVGGSDARMGALVGGEVDERDGLFHAPESGIGNSGGRAGEGEHAAIVIRIGFAIEQHDFGDGEDGLHDGVDAGGVAPFGEIRDALYKLSRHSVLQRIMARRPHR